MEVADVQTPATNLNDTAWRFRQTISVKEIQSYHTFMTSRWFKRGWTLQELLAPSRLVFYGNSWARLGSKPYMSQILSECTGVDEPALRSLSNIKRYVVARKMSWAAGRTTTRVEDRAYSLLGLFDINMPLLYGEDDNAFIRLQEEIVRTSTDQSIFAWYSPSHEEVHNTANYYTSSRAKASTATIATTLFAQSPDNFKRSRNVVAWPAENTPYRLTNQGVTFESACLVKAGSSTKTAQETVYYVILNCKLEKDLSGPLALSVRRRGKNNTCILSNDRLQVCKDYDEYHEDTTAVTILRRRPLITVISSLEASNLVPKIWVRNALPRGRDSHMFLDPMQPHGRWDRITGVMCPKSIHDMHGQVRVHISIERHSFRLFILAFKPPAVLHYNISGYERAASSDFQLALVQDAVSALASPDAWATSIMNSFTNTDSVQWTATVKIEQILGDIVYVIEITAGPPRDTLCETAHRTSDGASSSQSTEQ